MCYINLQFIILPWFDLKLKLRIMKVVFEKKLRAPIVYCFVLVFFSFFPLISLKVSYYENKQKGKFIIKTNSTLDLNSFLAIFREKKMKVRVNTFDQTNMD